MNVHLTNQNGRLQDSRRKRNNAEDRLGRILIVDDDQVFLNVLANLLAYAGYEVVSAAGGKEGLELFVAENFDLVLTDLNMPDLDGWNLARLIKGMSPDIPVILITGEPGASELIKTDSSAIDRLVYKPFTSPDILRNVEQFLTET